MPRPAGEKDATWRASTAACCRRARRRALSPEVGWASGGLLGVGVFFVLSGYLITDLLLAERERRVRSRSVASGYAGRAACSQHSG